MNTALPDRPAKRRLAALTAVALAAGMLASFSASVAASASPPASEASSGQLIPIDPDAEPAPPASSTAEFEPGSYVVVLRDAPAALYTGGVENLRATNDEWDGVSSEREASEAYLDHLTQQQDAVAATVGADPTLNLGVTTNGFVSDLNADQAARLAADPRVERVVKNEIIPLASVGTSTEYLGLEGPDGVWQKLGGTSDLGSGVVVGVIDTGISPENPSFAGTALGTTPGSAPYRDADRIVFDKSDGGTFRGVCQTGPQFGAAACSTKIIGARYFVDGFGRARVGGASVGEYLSPRDGNGHGSHTAGTAAGEANVSARGMTISGVTPKAKIAVYKACWSGTVPAYNGCATADLLAAIDAATVDNVDVINYSIGGLPATTTNSVVDQAFMAAASTGIFVAAAAGNSGPASSTLDNASPWITTVAASTIPAPPGTVVLGDGRKMLGATTTVPVAGVSAPLALSTQLAKEPTSTSAAQCTAGSLDPATTAGKVVVCERGGNARTEKSAEVSAAGGVGMILANVTPSSLDIDDHSVPTVHVDASDLPALQAYAQTPDARVTLLPGRDPSLAEPATPQIAGFSSRGPTLADGDDLIKPDIAAPGTTILAAHKSAEGATPTFAYESGTSMASPHIAGLAALYLSQHPLASPAEIKSAMMTSATDTLDAQGAPARDPFAQGNGQVQATQFLQPGLLYLNTLSDWQSYLKSIGQGPSTAADVDASDLNLPSIAIGQLAGTQTVTRTVTSTQAGSYEAQIVGLAGVDAVVQPTRLDFSAAGEQKQFTITFTRADAPLDSSVTGYLEWQPTDDTRPSVRSAIAVRPVAFSAPSSVTGSGTTGEVGITPSFGDTAEYDLHTAGLARGSRVNGTGTVGAPAARFAVSVPEGTDLLRLDLHSIDPSANLDLTVFGRNPDGSTVMLSQSATASADEVVELDSPSEGTYVAEVSFTGRGGSEDLGFTLTSYVLDADQPDAAFEVTPTRLSGSIADSPSVRASWSNLAPGSYFGVVGYGDTGISTTITIDAGTPVVTPGTPTLTVSPAESEWLLGGADLRVTATGLSPNGVYEANIDGGEPERRGTANEDGVIDWLVSSAGHTTPGLHHIRFTGDGIDQERSFRTSPVTFSGGEHSVQTTFSGMPALTLGAYAAGEGTVRFEVRDASGTVVASRDVTTTPQIFLLRSPEIPLPAGTYTATASSLYSDGTTAATYTYEPIELTASPSGSVAVSPPDGQGRVTVTTVNNSDLPERALVTYRVCDGSRVAASEIIPPGESAQTWSLAGASSVTLVDRLGKEIWRSEDARRCSLPFTDPIGQDLWITARAAATEGPDYSPARPIAGEVGYRYEPGITVYTLSIGEQAFSTTAPFFQNPIEVPLVEERGPISRTPYTAPENTPTWGHVLYFANLNGNETIGSDEVTMSPLRVADLVPDKTVVTAGSVTISGEVRVGSPVHVDVDGWSPAGVTMTYQWLIDGTEIDGATRADYTPAAADAGRALSVRAVGTAADGATAMRVSAAITVLAAEGTGSTDPDPTATPRDGGTLPATGRDDGALPAMIALALLAIAGGCLAVRHHRRTSRRV